VQKVWQAFEIYNFKKYHDFYFETDVFLLADVFINYTIICLNNDGLDRTSKNIYITQIQA
jgi:hypothetical protein